MNYSFMSFSCPELTLDEMLALAKRVGYDGIEPRIDSGHKHGIEVKAKEAARAEARRKAEESGIALCCVATSCRYADADASNAQEKADYTRRCIDLAADVGAPRLRVFGGQIPEGVSREKAIEAVAESLASVADHAADRGVVVCMETHDDWCAPGHVAEVMARVDHSAIGANWDIMHPVRRGDATMDGAFETLKSWIRHLHIHDGSGETGELVPIGDGIIDHRRAIELLLTLPYDGYLSGEWINWEDAYDIHLPRELSTLKQYEQEAAGA